MQKIELTWDDITNDVFLGVVQRMLNSGMPFPVTQKMLLLAKVVNNERSHYNAVFDKLKSEFGEKVTEDGKEIHRVIPAKKEEFQAKHIDALNHKFTTKIDQIPQEHLREFRLNVNEMLAIAPILVDGAIMRDEASDVDKHNEAQPKNGEGLQEAQL